MSATRDAPVIPARHGAHQARTQTPGRGRAPSAWRNRLHRFDMRYTPYLLVSPFFLLFAVFGLFPIIFNGVIALRTYRLDSVERGWAGLENFRRLWSDDVFWNAVLNTFGIFVLSTVPQLLLALIIASLLNRKLRAQGWFRASILLPYITPLAASTLVFSIFFSRDHGMANWALGLLGIGSEENPIDWRSSKTLSWIAIATMVNWKWIGYNALLYLAAMQTIPRDIYEAAAVDGASPWKQLWRITVPMIRPVVIFTVVLSTIGGLQLFTEPMLFEQNPQAATGGASGQWQTVAQLIYRVGWKNLNLGYAAAMSWALFLIIVVVAVINAVITNRLGSGSRMGGRK
jgi:cellobiose transport system permease protein